MSNLATLQRTYDNELPDDDFDEFYDEEEVARTNDEERIARFIDAAASKEYA